MLNLTRSSKTLSTRKRSQPKAHGAGIGPLQNVKESGSSVLLVVANDSQAAQAALDGRESWTCSNTACGLRVRISDGELLQKVTLLMNRIIENADLLLPHEIVRRTDSPAVQELQQQIANEMLREQPDEQRIVDLLREIAGQLYRQTNAKTQIAAQIARKRAALMHPQDAFNSACFSSLIDAVSLSAGGSVILHTKTQTEIYESEDKPNGSTENPKADSHPD